MSAADLGLVDPVRVEDAVDVESVPISVEPQKFSMRVTLPTALPGWSNVSWHPARLVKRILAGEFVDMGELSEEALRAEFRRSGEEGGARNLPWPSFARCRIGMLGLHSTRVWCAEPTQGRQWLCGVTWLC